MCLPTIAFEHCVCNAEVDDVSRTYASAPCNAKYYLLLALLHFFSTR